jgi:transposase InsO family protein
MKMDLIYSSPYHSTGNSRIERQNRTVSDILQCLCQQNPKVWDEYLPPAIFSINNTACEELRTSPHTVVFGKDLPTLLSLPPLSDSDPAPHAIQDIHAAQSTVLKTIETYNKNHPKGERQPHKVRIYDAVFWRRKAPENTTVCRKQQ